MGRNDGSGLTNVEAGLNHSSAPLSTLKDPTTFGPPPKRLDVHGEEAYEATRTPAQRAIAEAPSLPTTSSRPQQQKHIAEPEEYAEEQEEAHHVDRRAMSTSNMPKPPRRTDAPQSAAPTRADGPKLPPRLPPRQNSHPDTHAPDPPPTYHSAIQEDAGMLNKGSLNRLGKAGVSVPGFDIRGKASPKPVSRFSNTSSSTGPSSPTSAQPAGTSWAQKRSAAQTAANFKKDPSSVSLSDARSAATTANSFRQRHGEQVATGVKTANGFNQQYGVTDRVNSNSTVAEHVPATSAMHSVPVPALAAVATKKGPPPPPPKKKGLATAVASEEHEEAPPPIPVSSKPRF